MTKVFVIILNWNRPKLTLECLKSIDQLLVDGYQLTVLVVDNGSTDKSVDEINKYLENIDPKRGAKRELLINKSNLGFAEGNNVGIEHALKNNADYVLVLNNDTIVDGNLINELIKIVKKNPEAGVVAPKIYFAKGYEFHKKRYKKSELGRVIWIAGGRIDWKNVFGENRGVNEVDKGQYDEVCEVDFASGACALYNAKALEEVGFYNEKYYMYLEDADLSIRMKKKGWKTIYAPKAILWHKVAQSSRIGSNSNDYFIGRNRMLFGMLYAPLRAKLALIKESLRFLINGRKWQKIGIIDFYLGRYGKGSWK